MLPHKEQFEAGDYPNCYARDWARTPGDPAGWPGAMSATRSKPSNSAVTRLPPCAIARVLGAWTSSAPPRSGTSTRRIATSTSWSSSTTYRRLSTPTPISPSRRVSIGCSAGRQTWSPTAPSPTPTYASGSPQSPGPFMHADAAKLLWDAQQAAERIARFTAGKTIADYSADEQLGSACERTHGNRGTNASMAPTWILLSAARRPMGSRPGPAASATVQVCRSSVRVWSPSAGLRPSAR